MTCKATRPEHKPVMEPVDEAVDHVRGFRVLGRVRRDVGSGMASGEVRGTPDLFIDGVVHRGGYDAAALLQALARSGGAQATRRILAKMDLLSAPLPGAAGDLRSRLRLGAARSWTMRSLRCCAGTAASTTWPRETCCSLTGTRLMT
jgi:hypothetical protein